MLTASTAAGFKSMYAFSNMDTESYRHKKKRLMLLEHQAL